MSEIGLFSVGNGDTSYIQHNSDNFTLIDCCIPENDPTDIIGRIAEKSKGKGINRFISTHPDEDHILGLKKLHEASPIYNFYVVRNNATKPIQTESFKQYCALRDDTDKSYYIYQGCKRRWMNDSDDERGSSGVSILWPNVKNQHYVDALAAAEKGTAFNNMSTVIRYKLVGGASCIWLGDLETDFMANIETDIDLQPTDIVIAAHHGRKSGKIPDSWLKKLSPKIIVIGEAPSRELNYYNGYNTLTQNRCGDIIMDLSGGTVDIYTSKDIDGVRDWLENNAADKYANYIGTLSV